MDLHQLGNQRGSSLLGLSRDSPQFFFCYTCSLLHLAARVDPPRSALLQRSKGRQRCLTDQDRGEVMVFCFKTKYNGPVYRLTAQHLQLVMEVERQGSIGGALVDSLSTVKVQRDEYRWPKTTTLLSVDPAVIDHALYLTVQRWIVCPVDQTRNAGYRLGICAHHPGLGSDLIADLLHCKIHHADSQGCVTCHPLLKCLH